MRSFRVYSEGPASGPRCQLLDAWRKACAEEEQALERGQWVRLTLARIARVACEEALLDARRN